MGMVFKVLFVLAWGVSGSVLPAQQTPVGWRMDGTGNYVSAQPPTTWDKTKNVIWKVKLPGGSQGSPIIVGDRILVASDPAELLCLNAADGTILWQRPNGTAEVYGAEQASQMVVDFKRLREEKGKIERTLEAAKGNEEKTKAIRQQIDDLNEKLRQLPTPPEFVSSESSNSAPTPVSDGQNVYAVFGSGMVSAHTLSGERLWIKHVEVPADSWGHCSSPVLADGKVVVHLNDLYALDAQTGETAWKAPLGARHATSIVTELQGTTVIISPAGAVVRADDGKVLLKSDLLSAHDSTPILHDGMIYSTSDGRCTAVRLTSNGQDEVKAAKVWEGKVSGGGRTPSPVLHDGLLYGVNTDGILDVVDAATGKPVYKKRLNLERVYSSAVAAGDYIFINATKGTSVVLQAGREFKEVGRNELEGLGSNPVFQDQRMLFRAREHLYCIGE